MTSKLAQAWSPLPLLAAARITRKRSAARWALAALLWLGAGPALAEDVDPRGDGSQYGYGENLGWLNAEPLGDGGPGVAVDGGGLSGYLWSENVGWISLSCQNTSSCDTVDYGVLNDGVGKLSGLAWSENVGWIDFRPSIQGRPVDGAGVSIHPATGDFAGLAWSENFGWLSFSFADPTAELYEAETSWRATLIVVDPAHPLLIEDEVSGGDSESYRLAVEDSQEVEVGFRLDASLRGEACQVELRIVEPDGNELGPYPLAPTPQVSVRPWQPGTWTLQLSASESCRPQPFALEVRAAVRKVGVRFDTLLALLILMTSILGSSPNPGLGMRVEKKGAERMN